MSSPNDYLTPAAKPPRQEVILNQEVGRFATEFNIENLEIGILHLYVKVIDESTQVRIYVSSAWLDDNYFPKLQSSNQRSRIHINVVAATTVSLAWDPVFLDNLYTDPKTRYCAVVSESEEMHTYCELQNYDSNPVQPQNLLYSDSHTNRRKQPHLFCTETKLEYTFTGLKPETDYFVNLFAINLRTSGSVAYEGATFKTDSNTTSNAYNPKVTLQNAKKMASYLNPTRGATKVYEFPVTKFIRELVITVQPCSGYIQVQVFKDGKRMKRTTTEVLKIFHLLNLKPTSVVEVKIKNDDNDAKVYKIWASSEPSRIPYPKLPVDTSVKVLEHSRTCNSVTLAWLGSTEEHEYCLHMRAEKEDYFKQLILEEHDACNGPPFDMKRVFCRREKVIDDNQAILNATVHNLLPATTYRFDLSAAKPYRERMSYRTVWVKTRAQC